MSKENIATLTNVSNIYDVLDSLEKKGVIGQLSLGKPRSRTNLFLTKEAAHHLDRCRKYYKKYIKNDRK